MSTAERKLRIGTVAYLVAEPLHRGLEDEPGVELVREVPSRLVADLRAGAVDVALVSSIELFRAPGYAYLDGPAVTGRGEVVSVQVFLRRPLAELEAATTPCVAMLLELPGCSCRCLLHSGVVPRSLANLHPG